MYQSPHACRVRLLCQLLDLNPEGWHDGMANKNWRAVNAMGVNTWRGSSAIVYAGDDLGKMYVVDPRADRPADKCVAHKSKVTCVDVNPLQHDLLLTCGK